MASLGGEDPFVSVQKEVQAAWDTISADFNQWNATARPNAAATRPSRDELNNKLHTIEWDIQDLQEAVRVAKVDPAKFGLSPVQVAARERFVSEMMRNVQGVKAALDESEANGGASITRRYGGKREELVGGAKETVRQKETRQANENFIDDEMLQQERIMEQQDEDLDHLATAVERIGLMGHDMHQELAEQGQLLDGLADDMDTTRSRMAAVRQKLDRFMAETGPKQFCTIVGLCITFLVLTVLVATT